MSKRKQPESASTSTGSASAKRHKDTLWRARHESALRARRRATHESRARSMRTKWLREKSLWYLCGRSGVDLRRVAKELRMTLSEVKEECRFHDSRLCVRIIDTYIDQEKLLDACRLRVIECDEVADLRRLRPVVWRELRIQGSRFTCATTRDGKVVPGGHEHVVTRIEDPKHLQITCPLSGNSNIYRPPLRVANDAVYVLKALWAFQWATHFRLPGNMVFGRIRDFIMPKFTY